MSELIAPGGSYTKAMVAAHYGADAIYLGVPFTSLRMRQNKVTDFVMLKKTIDDLHALGKKAYLTMNIFPRNTDIKIFERITEQVADLGSDAIIFSDPGTFMTLKKYMPNQRYHLSTQTNTLNYEAVRFREQLGVHRVVLARELTLTEIKDIKKQVPAMELEVFVHGAMCVTYSGRCLMGEYFSGREGNKGECSHVCRYKFTIKQEEIGENRKKQEEMGTNRKKWEQTGNFDDLQADEQVITIEEEKRPGKPFDLLQDATGSYMFSSKDLCTIEYMAEMLPYIDGLKIEGRSKGEFYVGSVTKAYKHVRDCVLAKRQTDSQIVQLIYDMPHRPYRSGFLFADPKKDFPDGEGISQKSKVESGKSKEGDYTAKKTKDDVPVAATVTDSHAVDPGISYSQSGPSVGQEYFGLIEPEYIEVSQPTNPPTRQLAYKFTPKQVINVGEILSLMGPENLEKVQITGLFDPQGNALEQVNCNTAACYVTTNIPLQGWEILYSDPVNY